MPQLQVEEGKEGDIEGKTTGRLKFFVESQHYGFIVEDLQPGQTDPGPDLFFHFDDMKKTGLSRQFLKEARDRFIVKFRFRVMPYHGKYKQSKKVVDLELINIEPLNKQNPQHQMPAMISQS